MSRTYKVFIIMIGLGVAFQIGHFIEHLVQFLMWVFSDRTKPWMSPIAEWLTMCLSKVTDTGICSTTSKPMAVGMELLHLTGNTIFLATIFMLLLRDLINGFVLNHYTYWAFIIEGLHLCEHLALTISVILTGHALGVSTLFGHISSFPIDTAVGYRVTFHFVMNLIPSILLMLALRKGDRDV